MADMTLGVLITADASQVEQEAAKAENGIQSLRAVMFTAAQFPGVKQVKIAVEGEPYQPPEAAQTTFLNQDTEIMTYYPGVIEMD